MKKCFKKALSGILASAMLLSSVAFGPVSAFAAPSFGKVGGWFESIYAEIPGISDADVTGVSYSGTASGSLSGQDLQYLVRDYNGGVRIDIPGLQAGTYTLTVNTADGNVTKENISVMAYDRSGYAHFNYSEGVGAYDNDGTPKENAIILYVTEENKNDVTLTYNGKTVTGIGNILNSRGATGTVTNTNQQILKDLATNNVPLIVRIVGEVKAGDSNTSNNPPAENINGLTVYDSTDCGGTVGDNGMMARIQDAKDITIEGIGPDASMNGWGIHFVCGTAAYAAGAGKSCEIRNIYFQNYPEDAFGAEGQQEGSTLTASVERIWVHNNNFGPGYCKNPTEGDKAEGDGSCDFKRGQYYTMAYNKYWDCHKTNLIGSSDSSLQFHMSMHHNYYENCMARGPLARQGNIHMYNNVYIGQTDYAMNTRANAYIFSEYNLLYMCKNPMRVDSGAIKSYNDSVSCYIDEMGGTVVTDKNQKVSSGNKYENFDTNSTLSYIPSGDYILQEDVSEAKKVVMAYTGVMKEDVVTPDEVSTTLVDPGKQPSASVVLPYSKDLTSAYLAKGSQTVDNIYFSASKTASDSITIKEGQAIVFAVNTNANITITDGGASYPVVLMNEDGIEYLTGSGTAYNVPAGTYFIQPSGFSPAKGGEEASYKEAKITFLGIEAYDPSAPTVTEPTTQATTEGDVETTTRDQGGDVEEPTEETTEGIQGDPVLMGTYVFGDNASGGDFNVTEKKSAAGNMTIELRDVSDDGARVRKDDGNIGIAFNLTQQAEITINYSGKGIEIYNTGTGETITFADGESPQSAVLEPGNYSISGNNTGSNSSISQIVLKATGDVPATTTTEATTEATTADVEEPTETTTEKTETTTEAPEPVGGVSVSVGEVSGVKVGDTVTVPVKVTGLDSLASYDIDLNYDSSKLEVVSVTNGDMIDVTDDTFVYNTANAGVVSVSAVNTEAVSGDTLFNVTFRAAAEGTANITLTVNELFAENLAEVDYTVDNGSVTITEETTEPTGVLGDVDKDGDVDKADAATLLRYLSGIITADELDLSVADYNEDGKTDVLDVVAILKGLEGGSDESTETTTAATTTEATTTTATTTTEADTETTTEEVVVPVEGAVALPYSIDFSENDVVWAKMQAAGIENLREKKTLDNIEYSLSSDYNEGKTEIRLKGDGKYIKFTIAQSADLIVNINNSGRVINILNESGDVVGSINAGDTTPVTLSAGTYTLVSGTTSEVKIDSFSLTPVGGSTPVEPPTEEPTEAPTEEPTEATTEAPTEATTAEEPTEPSEVSELTDEYMALNGGTLTGGEHDVIVTSSPTNAGTLTVGEDMGWKPSPTTITDDDGNTYQFDGYVAGTNNPSPAPTGPSSVPTSGAYLKFTPTRSGVVTLGFKVNGGKTVYAFGETYAIPADAEAFNTVERYTVSAGKTYYVMGTGTKVPIYYFGFTPFETEPEQPEPDTPSGGDVVIEGDVVNIEAGDSDTLLAALYTIEPGQTINLAPGTYEFTATSPGSTPEELTNKVKIFSDNSGTADAPKVLTCTDGYAVLDFSNQEASDSNNRGVQIDGDYWNVSNLHVKGAADNGMFISGHHINVENCIFEGNRDSGLQISRKGSSQTNWPSDILIKNCTSFDNKDSSGENADGFAAKLTCGENIVFDNCISYNNSDDGWDLYAKKETGPIGAITIRNCVAFNNGKTTDGSGSTNGDMNGFKLGGDGIAVAHRVENCVAFRNGACGFTDNDNPGPLTLINCTSYSNGQYKDKANFNTYRTTDGSVFKNCISYGLNTTDKFCDADMTDSIMYNGGYIMCNGTFARETDAKNEPEANISDSDFVSLDLPYSDLSKVHEQMRNADGSINMKDFLEISSSSKFAGLGANIN